MEKMEKPNMENMRGSRRPFSSDNGAQSMGPVANPRTYNEIPRIPTSVETPKTELTIGVAAEKILLPNAAVSVV